MIGAGIDCDTSTRALSVDDAPDLSLSLKLFAAIPLRSPFLSAIEYITAFSPSVSLSSRFFVSIRTFSEWQLAELNCSSLSKAARRCKQKKLLELLALTANCKSTAQALVSRTCVIVQCNTFFFLRMFCCSRGCVRSVGLTDRPTHRQTD